MRVSAVTTKTKVVTLTKVDLDKDAAFLTTIADWIDQTVRVGTDEAAQLRAIAGMLQNLALCYREIDRVGQVP